MSSFWQLNIHSDQVFTLSEDIITNLLHSTKINTVPRSKNVMKIPIHVMYSSFDSDNNDEELVIIQKK